MTTIFKKYSAILVIISLFFILVIPWLFPVFLVISLFFGWIESARNSPPTEELLSNKSTPRLDNKLVEFRLLKTSYLHSPQWDNKRKQVLARDNYTCQSCGIDGVPLSVHHISGYHLIPNEPITCLVSLCKECHTYEHEKHGYPNTYAEYMFWDYPITKK